MNDLYQHHIDITKEVKEAIAAIPVVFPAEYSRYYTQAAHARDIELKPDEILSSEMLDEKMVRHVITLARCTDDAINAIATEDKESLKLVLLRTKVLQQEIQELQKIVYEDALTKSYNRKWFDDTIRDIDHVSIRGNGTLVMVDINKFKSINDQYGHVVGDKVLIHIASRLKGRGGRVVRYGGDEFLVIFDEETPLSDIEGMMETLQSYYNRTHFKVDTHEFEINFAYGIARFTHGSDINTIIDAADRAMYHHKSNTE